MWLSIKSLISLNILYYINKKTNILYSHIFKIKKDFITLFVLFYFILTCVNIIKDEWFNYNVKKMPLIQIEYIKKGKFALNKQEYQNYKKLAEK